MIRRILTVSSVSITTCFFLTFPLVRMSKQAKWRWTGAGLIGSLAGVLSVPFFPQDPWRCVLALIGCTCISAVLADVAEEHLRQKDDQRIVIDEWLGYLISVALLPSNTTLLALAFVLFRVIDTWKPLGVNRLAKLPGGWGIIMDDVAGGLVVNAILRLLPLQ